MITPLSAVLIDIVIVVVNKQLRRQLQHPGKQASWYTGSASELLHLLLLKNATKEELRTNLGVSRTYERLTMLAKWFRIST